MDVQTFYRNNLKRAVFQFPDNRVLRQEGAAQAQDHGAFDKLDVIVFMEDVGMNLFVREESIDRFSCGNRMGERNEFDLVQIFQGGVFFLYDPMKRGLDKDELVFHKGLGNNAIFLLGKGVDCENIQSEKFDVADGYFFRCDL